MPNIHPSIATLRPPATTDMSKPSVASRIEAALKAEPYAKGNLLLEDCLKELKRLTALEAARRDYIAYLEKADGMSAGFLYAHSWQHSPEIIKEGEHHRAKIAALTDDGDGPT